MAYTDSKSLHYDNAFKHVKTFDFENGEFVSMFADENLNCVIERMTYGKPESITQSDKMNAEQAQNLWKRYTVH